MEKIQWAMSALGKYKIEAGLLIVASVISFISIGVYFSERNSTPVQAKITTSAPKEKPRLIMIDIEGAVQKPGVYALPENARLKDAIASSKGLSDDVDLLYFIRNFNQARILSDQEKIYIPSNWEAWSGLFDQSSTQTSTSSNQNLIDVNNASQEELEELPGIGEVTAEKIMVNRPYQTIEELSERKIVGQSVFEKIRDHITVVSN